MGRKKSPPPTVGEIEWAGTGENPAEWVHDEGFEALRTKDMSGLGQYLREAQPPEPEIMREIADLFDPPKDKARLKFVAGRGRPLDAQKMFEDSNIAMLVIFALKRNNGQLEAAVSEVMNLTGKGRSTVFAALSRRKTKSSN